MEYMEYINKLFRVFTFSFLLSLLVDMLSLSTALEQFDSHGLRAQNDKLIDIPDMVTVLTSLYEVIAADNQAQVSVPLCIDLAINWLLNVYDRYVNIILLSIILSQYCRLYFAPVYSLSQNYHKKCMHFVKFHIYLLGFKFCQWF